MQKNSLGRRPPERGKEKSVDIKEAFTARQNIDADGYFKELDPIDQAAMMERYNEQQKVATLGLKTKATKLAQAAFMRWLAIETWGEPSTEELLAFAQDMLSGSPRS